MDRPHGKPLVRAQRPKPIRPPTMPRFEKTRLVPKLYPVCDSTTEPEAQKVKEEPKHGYNLRSCITSQPLQPQSQSSSSMNRSKMVPSSKMTIKGRYMQVTFKPKANKPTVHLLSQLWAKEVKEKGYSNNSKIAVAQNSGKTSTRVGKRARESLSDSDGKHKGSSLMKRNRELDAESRMLVHELIGIKEQIEDEDEKKKKVN